MDDIMITITITYTGKTITLTSEEAKHLRDELNRLYDMVPVERHIPFWPVYPKPYYPEITYAPAPVITCQA